MKDIFDNVCVNNFNHFVLNFKGLVMVYFWSTGCFACKNMFVLLSEISKIYTNKLKIVKLNVIDHNISIAQKYKVKGLPTIILFNFGDIVAFKAGIIQRSHLIEIINKHL